MTDQSSTLLQFEAIHDDFRARVLRYLTRLVGPADAEDVAQAVMLKVNQALPDFRGDSSVSTWIYRIATNAAMDRLRSKANQPPEEESDHDLVEAERVPDAATPSTEATAIRDEMNACIREFVERLSDNYKTVMVLSEIEGFRNDEIAAILGISVDTVKIRLHRAREKLRNELKLGCSLDHDANGELACDRKPATVTLHPRK